MRKTNKKLLVSLSVLATPFIVENFSKENIANANNTYNLNQNVKVYSNAQNAAKQVNASKTYTSGTYYVYKEHNGMINISKTQGKAGAWINPVTNKPVAAPLETPTSKAQPVNVTSAQVPTPKIQSGNSNPITVTTTTAIPKRSEQTTQVTKPQTQGANTYTLNNNVKVYNNAALAKSQKDSKATYSTGNYFIYKEFNGMINISRVAGRAGAWINPVENKAIIAKNTPATLTTAQKPAEVKVVTPSATKNNPAPVKQETAPANNSSLKAGSTYILKSRTNIYNNAVDARNGANPKNTYGEGTYYVYKTYNGMINISRIRGRVGAWINPLSGTQDVSKTSNPASTQKPENSPKPQELAPYSTASNKVVYYNQDDPAWKNKKYGKWTMGHTACVPTSLAMAISTLATNVTPIQVADILYKSGHFNGKGGLGTYSSGLPAVLEKFGLKYKTIKSKADLKTELTRGGLVYAAVDGQPFVNPGYSHAMIVKGLDSKGNATVYNPLTKRGIQNYSLDSIWNKKSKIKANLSLGAPMLVLYK